MEHSIKQVGLNPFLVKLTLDLDFFLDQANPKYRLLIVEQTVEFLLTSFGLPQLYQVSSYRPRDFLVNN